MDAASPSYPNTSTIGNSNTDPNDTNSETTELEPQDNTQSISQPVPKHRLVEIATEACDSTFDSVTSYEHSQTGAWNAKIIRTVLQPLISATSNPKNPDRHLYKFAVTSTIIQHTTSSFPSTSRGDNTGDLTSSEPHNNQTIERRGMHSATGAFWNNARDGCWSFKYEKPEKEFDVVVSVIWIASET